MAIEIHPYIDLEGLKRQLNLNDNEIAQGNFKIGGIWFPDTRTIICGTFPPTDEFKNRQGYIHYSSSKNQYWKHIDAVFDTKLFIKNSISKHTESRIKNAMCKIEFAKTKQIGFVDLFTKIDRKKVGSSKDTDLIEVETIFQNGVFDELIKGNVQQFVFVYSLSKDIFIKNLETRFKITPKTILAYSAKNIPLGIQSVKINEKTLYLTYCPIHGPNVWTDKQRALKKAIEFDLT
ncbi:MAG TPA: hypothetical protein VL442_06830 [Mucilaginibacter sp.]|jgi:G:T/U-mismatch repair DNA glycosylase|nr:hypothetical protein [Mucilaginibacter sp.]